MANGTYDSISDDDITAKLAEAFIGREQEVFHYDLNISNYTAMLEALPQGDWPKELLPFKGKSPDNYPSDKVQEIADLEFRDRLSALLRTEQIERGKSALVLATLKARIPAGQFAGAISSAKARTSGALSAI